MHELSIMTGVMDSVVRAARHAGASEVLSVDLQVGRMTEAIPDALQFSWEVLQEGNELIAHAQLNIEIIEPYSSCLKCGAEYEHDRFHRSCPQCGSTSTALLRGRELTIASMEVRTPD